MLRKGVAATIDAVPHQRVIPMNKHYYETIDKLEKMNIDREYIQGWIGGYLENPEREEQRISEAYSAGYADGKQKKIDNAEAWKKSS